MRVGEAGQDAAAAEVDGLRARQRRLVHADAAGDPLACDPEGRDGRQGRVERADRRRFRRIIVPMFDHVGLNVRDYERSRAFYETGPGAARLDGPGGMARPRRRRVRRPGRKPRVLAPSARALHDGRAHRVHLRRPRDRRRVPRRGSRRRRHRQRPARGCAGTTRTTTAPSCSTPTATTSRPSATKAEGLSRIGLVLCRSSGDVKLARWPRSGRSSGGSSRSSSPTSSGSRRCRSSSTPRT